MKLPSAIIVLGLGLGCGPGKPGEPVTPPTPAVLAYERVLLGTRFRLLLHTDDPALADRAAEAAFARVRELDAILSDYDPESEVRRLVREGRGVHPVSLDLHRVLREGIDLGERSGGAFDVCAGPLTRLWRRARRRAELPEEEDITRALERVRTSELRCQLDGIGVHLVTDDIDLDLGGIAKGYVVDEALAVLTDHGITSALVDGGGDLAVSGPPPGRSAWRVEVADLPGLQGEPLILPLVHGAVATSGDRYQALKLDGLVHSHLLDPRTGRALTDHAAATVLAPTAMVADGLASALCVLDPEEGMALLGAYPGGSARSSRGSGSDLVVHTSPNFPPTVFE